MYTYWIVSPNLMNLLLNFTFKTCTALLMAYAGGGCGVLDKNSAIGQEDGPSSLVCRHSSLKKIT